MAKVTDLDLYELLGIEYNANETAIKTAFRKKALLCHPDKNPNNQKALELFHNLTEAVSILTNVESRKKYDELWKSRNVAKQQNVKHHWNFKTEFENGPQQKNNNTSYQTTTAHSSYTFQEDESNEETKQFTQQNSSNRPNNTYKDRRKPPKNYRNCGGFNTHPGCCIINYILAFQLKVEAALEMKFFFNVFFMMHKIRNINDQMSYKLFYTPWLGNDACFLSFSAFFQNKRDTKCC